MGDVGDLQKYERGLANGPVDRKLLHAATDGLSPKEMSQAVGGIVTPEQAAQRVRDLLESRNWLTFFEQEQLLMESLNEIISGMRQWTDSGSVQHIKATLQAIKMKQDQLQRNRIDPETAANIIREGQARIMLSAIQVMMVAAADELARRYNVPTSEVHDIFIVELPKAVDAVERRIEQQ